MSRDDLKEIIVRVIETLAEAGDEAPATGCFFNDKPAPCDVTTYYAVGEEG